MSARARLLAALERAEALGVSGQLATIAERTVDTFERAAVEYDAIRWGQTPDRCHATTLPAVAAGETLPVLGQLHYVEYDGDKGGEWFRWCHPFEKEKPLLLVTREGKLAIAGGDYTVTDRGIVG